MSWISIQSTVYTTIDTTVVAVTAITTTTTTTTSPTFLIIYLRNQIPYIDYKTILFTGSENNGIYKHPSSLDNRIPLLTFIVLLSCEVK